MDYWVELRQAIGRKTLILPSAAGAIIKDNKILLVRQGSLRKWHISGGLMELNESIEETMLREIKEELDIDLEIDKLISIFSSPKWNIELSNGDKTQQVLFFFLLKGEFEEKNIRLQEEEIYEYKFFDLNSIPEDTMECCKEKVKCLLEFKGTTILR